ncbi:MlaD family protein [Desulfovibrio sp. ZJ369]|uniref:MlaD family protein n=1 Tax=Desulfovibrio sp. ZJ369 TaxID=2709793 RepID=UPI0013ECC5FC|nr:MlaD family protein [Desulfovibrio sp. ZJ369]
MNLQAHKTTVGAFVLGGLALLALGIIVLGGGRLFNSDIEYVLYFDGSVSGLSIGAPVVFRGVPLGSVTRISLVANARDSNVTIPVLIRIDEKSIVRANGGNPSEALQQEIIRRMVQRGLRAQLQLQSLITGQYRVVLDFHPGTPANFRSSTPDREIPTIPSPIDTIQRTLARLPLEQMVHSLGTILESVSKALGDGKLERGLAAFDETFEAARDILLNAAEMRDTADNVLKRIDSAAAAVQTELPGTLASFRTAMQNMGLAAEQLRLATTSAQNVLRRDSPTMNDVRRLLKESIATARSLRELATMLERNPEALLRGKKGTR